MAERDWKQLLSVWIVCGVVGIIVLIVLATMMS
jgi:hypothetical protein